MFTGFDGTIQLDAESNRYLNITLYVKLIFIFFDCLLIEYIYRMLEALY